VTLPKEVRTERAHTEPILSLQLHVNGCDSLECSCEGAATYVLLSLAACHVQDCVTVTARCEAANQPPRASRLTASDLQLLRTAVRCGARRHCHECGCCCRLCCCCCCRLSQR
jgi:hypothetical protein